MDLFIITKNVLKNGQSRESGNIEYVRRRKPKQKHNDMHWTPLRKQTQMT